MKLLIITQKVDKDDSALGFFCYWLQELSEHWEKVTVICLGKGEYSLPKNVKVISLGKETGKKWKIIYTLKFYWYVWRERKNYDTVFVHMNPIYMILAGWFWNLSDKFKALWYVHKQVSRELKIAMKFSDIVFSVVPESIGLEDEKIKFVGHGIRISRFPFSYSEQKYENRRINILFIGRITKIKNLETLIETSFLLKKKGFRVIVKIAGEPITKEDKKYFQEIKKIILEKKLDKDITFVGKVPYSEIPAYIRNADISINLTPTGGIDKVVLESMASGVPVFVSNVGFKKYFGDYSEDLIFKLRDAEDLTEKIEDFWLRSDKIEIMRFMRKQIEKKASLKNLMQNISKQMKGLKK